MKQSILNPNRIRAKADERRLMNLALILAEARVMADAIIRESRGCTPSVCQLAEAIRYQTAGLIRDVEAVVVLQEDYLDAAEALDMRPRSRFILDNTDQPHHARAEARS